jgi:hypothetical protein
MAACNRHSEAPSRLFEHWRNNRLYEASVVLDFALTSTRLLARLKVREEKALAEAEAAKEKARADAAANASEEKRLALEAETREAVE